MKYQLKLALGLLLLGSATSALGDNVRTDYDHGANFAQYHTYSWGKVQTSDPFYVARIKQAVDSQLQAKGWQLVPSGGAVTVFATDKIHNQQEVQTMYDGLGGGWGGGWAGEAVGLGRLGLGRRLGRSWIRRIHNYYNQPAGRKPGNRPLRLKVQKAALERLGYSRSLNQRNEKY